MVQTVLKCPLRWLQYLCVPQVKGPPHLPSLQVHAASPAQTLPTHRNLLCYPPGPQHPPCSAPWDSTQRLSSALVPGSDPACGSQQDWDHSGGRDHFSPPGKTGTECRGREEGSLEQGQSKTLQERSRGAPLHCPSAFHSLTSALAKLICLSRSSGIIFPLEEKTEWVEK